MGVFPADALLESDTPPSASGFAGSVLTSSAHGTAELTFTAADPGPGVYKVRVAIDGTAVYDQTPDTNGGECVPVGNDSSSGALMFDVQQPCPPSVDLDIPIDTSALSDGTHELTVQVEDAAQNTSTVLDQSITTDNFTTVAGTTSENPARPAVSTPPGAGSTPGGSPTTPTTAQPTTPPAPFAFELDQRTTALVASVLRSRYTASSVTLAGTVLQGGAPAANVTVSVQSAAPLGGGYTTIAQTATDGTGHFAITVPPGDSRSLRLAAGAAQVAFQQLVTPDLSLSARPETRERILFTGHVSIAMAGSPPPLIELEVYDPTNPSQRWSPFATTTPNAHGAFSYLYHLPRTLAGYRFAFRAATPATVGWQATASSTSTVTVKR